MFATCSGRFGGKEGSSMKPLLQIKTDSWDGQKQNSFRSESVYTLSKLHLNFWFTSEYHIIKTVRNRGQDQLQA